jgi:hypothetical protein
MMRPAPRGRVKRPVAAGAGPGRTGRRRAEKCCSWHSARRKSELSSKDPAVGLRAIASLRALLHSLERLHVENARKSGWSWQQIAAELGVSKQAVHEKHGTGRRLLRSKGP